MYVLLLGGLSYFFYSYFKKKDQRKQIHRDREMILKENLIIRKAETGTKERDRSDEEPVADALCTGVAYTVVTSSSLR